MASKIRSDTGCWTCRLRRKKCDENRESCVVCSSRGITCYGYGERPVWMDGGSREKEMATSVRQQLHRRLKRSWQARSQRSDRSLELQSQDVAPSEAEDFDFNFSHLSSVVQFGILTPCGTEQSPIFLDTIDLGHLPQDFDCPTSFRTETPALGIFDPDISLPLSPAISTTCKPPPIRDNIADLLMHYISKVFPEHYGVYCSLSPEHERGWLLALLMQSQPFLESCIATSAYHLSLVSNHQTEDTHQNHFLASSYQHRRSAMALLVEVLGSASLNENSMQSTQKTEILGCIMQLNLLQILQGGNEDWELLLNTIITFALPRPDSKQLGDKNTTSSLEHDEVSQLSAINIAGDPASQFFTGMAIRFDILSCASSKRTPEFSIAHRFALQTTPPQIDMRKLTGCENWVLLCILDITLLERWKSKEEAATTLSLIELASRVTVIESILDDGIRRLSSLIGISSSSTDETVKTRSKSEHDHAADPDSVIRLTTYIFACAAMIYLRTVTAGPNLRATELREGVNKGVEAISLLTNFPHVRNLVWPLYIVGCLATREQESVFRELYSSLQRGGRTLGNFSSAFAVMEACWSERWSMDGALRYCHWNAGMKKLGFYPLLV